MVDVVAIVDFNQHLLDDLIIYTIYILALPLEDAIRVYSISVNISIPILPLEYYNFANVFNEKKVAKLLILSKVEYTIETIRDLPFSLLYSLLEVQLKVLKEYIKSSLKKGQIIYSKSLARVFILFAPKKDDSLRLYIDYQSLNKVTIKNHYLLPLIREILNYLVGAKWYTKIDLKDAYYYIQIKLEDQQKMVFQLHYRHFEYQVMPFRLANALTIFQAYINWALSRLLNDICIIYLNDILIYSYNEESYIEYIHQVLKRLRQYSLYANLKKCVFSTTLVEFLGFIISTNGISIDLSQVATIVDWPEPKTFI